MLRVGILLLFILSGLPISLSFCRWNWEWSFGNPTPPASLPPLSPSCLVHQSDSVLLENSGSETMDILMVNASAVHRCDPRQPIGQSLALPPNSSIALNLSHSNQVESAVHIISQSKRGDCLKLSFSLTNQTRDNCDTPPECVSMGPCFRHLSVPLSQSAVSCQISPSDWIVAENRADTILALSHLSNASCYSNYSINLEPKQSALIPLSNIPQTGTLLLSDNNSCTFIRVHVSQTPCYDTLCHIMSPDDTISHLTPLAVSLMSLLILIAGFSALLALCLRKKQKISTEETPPVPGDLPGHYEMKNEGKHLREPEVKTRKKKSVPLVPLETPPAPKAEEVEPVRRSILLEKRSSQFSELLSKFS